MKIKFLVASTFLALFIVACNPNAGKELVIDAVKLNATINNTNESISIGDTLKIILKLPDTIIGTIKTQTVQSLQRGFFRMYINKVDTINGRSILALPPIYWTPKGTIENTNSFVLSNSSKPFEVNICFKPTEKGLYYLEVVAQPGVLKINGNSESNLLVNFSAIDKHLTLVSNYFGGQVWIDEAYQRNVQGFGVYAFRVN